MISYSRLHSGILQQEIQTRQSLLTSVIDRFTDTLNNDYCTPYGFINLPFDQSISEQVQDCIDRNKDKNPTVCIVIGIGGSILGTCAVYYALRNTIPTQRDKLSLCFLDTINSSYLAELIMHIEKILSRKQSLVVNVVSKSGTTLETVANFQVIANCIKRYQPVQYQDSIVITTDKGSALWNWGLQEGIMLLPIPESVGGRYSVFCPVSLFPLGLAGINIDQLLEGAREITSACLRDDQDNYAAQLAVVIYEWYTKGLTIVDLFFFMPEFEYIGKWLRQLIAESVGKREDINGNQVRIGLVPTVSIGSTDLHAVAQRYFGGAHIIGTIFYTIQHRENSLIVPPSPLPSNMTQDMVGKDIHTLMQAITQGTQRAYADQRMPYMHIELSEITPYYIGQLLQFHMMSVVYLSQLLHVNAFDQPEVERYKQKTNELLGHKIL
jgi:glucose-6-phosphate isomerase